MKCLSVSLVVLCAACYSSPVPLAHPGERIDSTLLGVWTEQDAAQPDAVEIRVFPFNDTEYYVEIEEGRRLSRFRAFTTHVGTNAFLNVQALDSEDRDYGVFRYTAKDRAVTLEPLKHDAPRFTRSAELQAWLMAHASDATIYDDTLRLRKL
jgi:hypothetical protein